MTTPHPSRAEGTRNEILLAAARLFRDRGYQATTLRDIAAIANMKAGSIYYHFDSKDEILAEVLDLGIERIHHGVRDALAALPPKASAVEAIETAIRMHLEVLLLYGDFTSANIRVYGQIPEQARRRSHPVRQAYADFWTTLLMRGRREGAVRTDIGVKMLRLLLVGSMNWTVEWYKPGKGPVRGIAEDVSKLFFEGVLTPEARTAWLRRRARHSGTGRRPAHPVSATPPAKATHPTSATPLPKPARASRSAPPAAAPRARSS